MWYFCLKNLSLFSITYVEQQFGEIQRFLVDSTVVYFEIKYLSDILILSIIKTVFRGEADI